MPDVLIINGLDVTSWVSADGYEVERADLSSSESGRVLNGDEHKDVVARIDKIYLKFVPLIDSQAQLLLGLVESTIDLTIKYVSPRHGLCQGIFHVGNRKAALKFRRNTEGLWDGPAFNLIEAKPHLHQVLEDDPTDLSDYYTKAQVDAKLPITIKLSEYIAMVNSGAWIGGRTYDIITDTEFTGG